MLSRWKQRKDGEENPFPGEKISKIDRQLITEKFVILLSSDEIGQSFHRNIQHQNSTVK